MERPMTSAEHALMVHCHGRASAVAVAVGVNESRRKIWLGRQRYSGLKGCPMSIALCIALLVHHRDHPARHVLPAVTAKRVAESLEPRFPLRHVGAPLPQPCD